MNDGENSVNCDNTYRTEYDIISHKHYSMNACHHKQEIHEYSMNQTVLPNVATNWIWFNINIDTTEYRKLLLKKTDTNTYKIEMNKKRKVR